jgi:glycosyltransferase involved in cell wall biosynthesis
MQFHILSFEGPDGYAQAGGIATRVWGLSESLAERGLPAHLWFVGDPDQPGHEERNGVGLHRWCQWISRYHPGGVYDGEEGKRLDYASSLPPYLWTNFLLPALQLGDQAVVLAEEWQTVDCVLHLDWLLRKAGARERVSIFWNANNTFGFERIDWQRLAKAAVITTVSRYMKQLMRGRGVDPIVIHNGLGRDAYREPDPSVVWTLRRFFRNRISLGKVGRWDPDKNWLLAVAIVAELKRRGWRPLLLARGGVEKHGAEVMSAARRAGLHVVERELADRGAQGLLRATADVNGADIVSFRSPLDDECRRVLFQAASAVLANSAHEPFGLVGLEAMAVGGLACTGYSGEDYAVPGRNALVMQTSSPIEFIGLLKRYCADPAANASLRRAARLTAEQYAWPEIIERALLPRVSLADRWTTARKREETMP